MKKENLVLVHSFPTNTVMLKGLKEFLDDYFNVYFLDLPGFNVNIPPLKNITYDDYSKYLEDYIKKLKLKDYFLGGISFGFLVVNNSKINKRCKGFLAIEPFINANYLKQKFILISLIKIGLFFVTCLQLHNKFYNSTLFKKILLLQNPKHRIETMIKTIDGVTFFETLKLLFNTKTIPKFQKKPYILLINSNDNIVNADKTIKLFKKLNNKLILKIKSEHYPSDITKKYFQKKINSKVMKQLLDFCKSV